MSSLQNKRILLGITGSIAAYKTPELVRRLREAGAEVQVVLTESGAEFVAPMSLQVVSGQPVRQNLVDAEAEAAMGHIELARWADLVLIAPATADCLSRLAQGRAVDLLTAVCLATDARVAVAPAMNRLMWENRATLDNCTQLLQRNILFFGPAEGEQACGETGPGRMLEVDELVQRCESIFATGSLNGQRVLVTAGPTREPIDPVRYLSNYSSGKMGFAVAEAAAAAGAEVILVSGPVALATPERVRRVDVETAEQMLAAVLAELQAGDIVIGVAAVADFRPRQQQAEKIKKSAAGLQLQLEKTPDIIATVSDMKVAGFILGFAAETGDVERYAQDKLERKGLDMIAANRVGYGLGFGQQQNALEVYWQGGHQSLPMMDKHKLANQLIDLLAERIHAENSIENT